MWLTLLNVDGTASLGFLRGDLSFTRKKLAMERQETRLSLRVMGIASDELLLDRATSLSSFSFLGSNLSLTRQKSTTEIKRGNRLSSRMMGFTSFNILEITACFGCFGLLRCDLSFGVMWLTLLNVNRATSLSFLGGDCEVSLSARVLESERRLPTLCLSVVGLTSFNILKITASFSCLSLLRGNYKGFSVSNYFRRR